MVTHVEMCVLRHRPLNKEKRESGGFRKKRPNMRKSLLVSGVTTVERQQKYWWVEEMHRLVLKIENNSQ